VGYLFYRTNFGVVKIIFTFMGVKNNGKLAFQVKLDVNQPSGYAFK